jgi:hypothetical protein
MAILDPFFPSMCVVSLHWWALVFCYEPSNQLITATSTRQSKTYLCGQLNCADLDMKSKSTHDQMGTTAASPINLIDRSIANPA